VNGNYAPFPGKDVKKHIVQCATRLNVQMLHIHWGFFFLYSNLSWQVADFEMMDAKNIYSVN
jgi:hypothetical protein